MATPAYDLIVVGSGPGGYIAAIRASQLGMKTAIVEALDLGGVCLNWGCIPTKALLRNAEMVEKLAHAKDWGFSFDNLKTDWAQVIKRSRDVAAQMNSGVAFLMKKNKVDVHRGFGVLADAHTVTLLDAKPSNDPEPGAKTIGSLSAKHILLATGSRAKKFPGVEVNGTTVVTAHDAMILKAPPKRLVIIGAGAIGMEFAYFYKSFGSDVTILEYLDRVLPVEDEEVSRELNRLWTRAGYHIHTGAKVESVDAKGKSVKVTFTEGGKSETVEGDVLLMAMGVQGNVENLGLEALGVKVERSFIPVDPYYKTNVEGVYAIGDVIGPPALAHVAMHEAVICVEAIAGQTPHPMDYTTVPGCTYCQPQVASVGLTEAKARADGYDVKVGKFRFKAVGKAVAIGETDGFVKLVVDAKYGEVLGAHIIGSEATEMIAELGLARSAELTAESLIHSVHAHPTLTEAIGQAALDAYGRALDS